MSFKVWAISDTHCMHRLLNVPDADMVIAAGDYTRPYTLPQNLMELSDFLNWFQELPMKYKIFIAGNHDSSIYHKWVNPREIPGVIYLENEEVVIEGIKIWGSPYTPTFGNWAFMKERSKLHDIWKHIPEDTDILVTHGPPKGVLDVSALGPIHLAGCSALLKRVMNIKPKYHVFGHVHNNHGIYNQGTRNFEGITFVNASCVTDREIDNGPTSHGILLEI